MFWTSRYIEVAGGSVRAWHAGREGDPTVVIFNAPGALPEVWSEVFAGWSETHRLITWSYRGLTRRPASAPRAPALPEESEGWIDDAEAVLDAYGVERAVFVGWTYGNHLLAAVAERRPEIARGLVLLSPVLGSSTAGERREPWPLADEWPELFRGAARWIGRHPSSLRAATLARLLSPTIDRRRMAAFASLLADANSDMIMKVQRMMLSLELAPRLARFSGPMLLISGGADRVCRERDAERLVEEVGTLAERGAMERRRIAMASHYLPLEFAEYTSLLIEQFLVDRECGMLLNGSDRE